MVAVEVPLRWAATALARLCLATMSSSAIQTTGRLSPPRMASVILSEFLRLNLVFTSPLGTLLGIRVALAGAVSFGSSWKTPSLLTRYYRLLSFQKSYSYLSRRLQFQCS